MNVAAAAAFSDVHLSGRKAPDDFFLQGLSASLRSRQETGPESEVIAIEP